LPVANDTQNIARRDAIGEHFSCVGRDVTLRFLSPTTRTTSGAYPLEEY
jgi:hypothetical protein